MKHKKLLWELFSTFFKIGLFTFGGGYAMISVIEDSCVERKKWITHDDMMTITVVAESTPGPIAINCATYVGGRMAGTAGAAAATFGVVLPSFCIIFAISGFLNNFLEITFIASAFKGIRIAVGLLILNAGLNMLRQGKKKRRPLGWAIVGCALFVMLAGKALAVRVSSIFLMLLAGSISLGAYLAFERKGDGEK